MLIWGTFWGALLGLFWRGHETEFNVVVGAVLGLLAGWSLRRVVRKEVHAARAAVNAAPGTSAHAHQPSPTASEAVPPPPPFMPATSPMSVSHAASPAVAAQAPAALMPAAAQQSSLVSVLFNRARNWLFGGNTVVRMGVLVLFIGLAFLAKYAVENALLPPELRLAAIGAVGIGLFLAGLRLRNHASGKQAYALTLQGAGVAVLYLTVFAAFRLYQFLPAGAAFAALGLICAFSAVIAIAQNAQAMALIGFAGGFAAPILASTGQGSHVSLFSYYTVLGVAIAAIAWARAWRSLNLLGFFATFGIATLWGALKYETQHLATTEPFLIGFFFIYVMAALLYALRHSHAPKQAVDATLIFGTPIAAFCLQSALVHDLPYAMAFSSLALGAFYLGLGLWLVRRPAGQREVNQWLAECFGALGLGFVTLAVPLALDGQLTSAVWAVEGAGVYWMGRRQDRWLPRAAGLALQLMAAMFFLDSVQVAQHGHWLFANPRFVGGTMLSCAALALAWWSRQSLDRSGMSPAAAAFNTAELQLSPVLFWVGFMWWQFALFGEIAYRSLDANGVAQPLLDASAQSHLQLVAWVASAFVAHRLALPSRPAPWPIAATPAWTALPLMLGHAFVGLVASDPVFQSGGWLAWPVVLVMHFIMLRRLDAGAPRPWWRWVHAGGVWLTVLLLGNLLVFGISKAALWQTGWATVILLAAGTAVMLVLGSGRIVEAAGSDKTREGTTGPIVSWPLDRFAPDYIWRAAAPLAVALAAGALIVAMYSRGNAHPLPYLPLLNPTDLAVGLALAACALWLMRLRASALRLPLWVRSYQPMAAMAAIGFVAINTVWLRVAHHFAAVPWDAGALFSSFLVQAGYSILWTLIALALMVTAHRRAARTLWMLGAGLLGFTVLKLFIIDLSNRGGSERIFVFIAVGLLMLVVGYFAPLPPATTRPAGRAENEGETA
ncbi:MAG: DUF2339 domain-containing protein [Bdellovibrionales bacterium]|nr:DUF2339 domain-containing protein [Ramlibacter sp.]